MGGRTSGGADEQTAELITRARPRDPLEQQRVADSVEAKLFGRPQSPITFGRYVLLERLGSGGGGIVHAAYDPELDRKVAIKLIDARVDASEDVSTAGARLLREAQAMAQLSHPNVIAVFDVGTYGPEHLARVAGSEGVRENKHGIYVVMELVDGPNLRSWVKESPRSWREILATFIAAGRGLAAAHAADLVHRDFKPSNVLVGRDGRVRVLDFGLARAAGAATEPADAAPSSAAPSAPPDTTITPTRAIDAPLTLAGTIMGTPPYMSPEQHRGDPTTARGDQYSFCVALWEALYGQRPFAQKELEALGAAKREGPPPPPANARVPAWIHRALVRGLSVEPEARFPDMGALLSVLGADPGRRARRWAVGIAAVLALAGVGYGGWSTAQVDRCASPTDELAGIWDDSTKAAIERAFAGTGAPFADDVWAAVRPRLDAYAQQWRESRRTVCEDTLVHEHQPMAAMSERMLCLDRRLTRLGGLTRSFTQANANTVERAVTAAASLPSLAPCMRTHDAEVTSAPSRDEVLAIESELAEASALRSAVRFDEARSVTTGALERAEALGDPDTLARAWLSIGALHNATGDHTGAEEAQRRALNAAEDARDDELAVRAMVALVFTVGDNLARPDEAIRIADHAAARLRAADLEASLGGRLALLVGRAHETAGRYTEALASFEDALALTREHQGDDHPQIATIHNLMGVALDRHGRYREALGHYELALDARRRTIGPDHPSVAVALANVSIMKGYLGLYGDAVEGLEQAVAIFDRAYEEPTHTVAWFIDALGYALTGVDRFEDAMAQHRRAFEIRKRTVGPDHPEYAMSLSAMADISCETKRYEEGLRLARDAVRTRERVSPDHPRLAQSLLTLGDCLGRAGEHAEAVTTLERALDLAERTWGADNPIVATTAETLAENEVETGAHADAVVHAERALKLRQSREPPPLTLAWTRFVLARALASTEPGRALELARQAEAVYATTDLRVRERKLVETWLAKHDASSSAK